MKKILFMIIATALIIVLYFDNKMDNRIQTLSVSSNGQHVISSSRKGQVTLWDIKNKKQAIIDKIANRHSVYFLRNSPYYMWHAKNREVKIQHIDGTLVKSFKNPTYTYGQVITSDLQHYYYYDGKGAIMKGVKGYNVIIPQEGDWQLVEENYKFINLYLSDKENKLLYNSLISDKAYVLNAQTGSLINKFDTGNRKPDITSSIVTAISPNSEKVIISEKRNDVYSWDLVTEEITRLKNIRGNYIGYLFGNEDKTPDDCFDTDELIDIPDDYKNYHYFDKKDRGTFAVKYINTQGHFLWFDTNSYYAVLYNDENILPLKYLSLRGHEKAVNHNIFRNQAIDTAPEAGILVMAKQNKHGIIVYQYDNTSQTLNKIWVSGCPHWDWFSAHAKLSCQYIWEYISGIYYLIRILLFGIGGL